MSKKKSKNGRVRESLAPADAPPLTSYLSAVLDWESVEVDFFARESELYQVAPLENFEDLDRDDQD